MTYRLPVFSMLWVRSFFAGCLLYATVGFATAAPVTEDPLERQTLDIAKGLRCAVCQNQPVSESNSELARDMRAIIREQVAAGKSRDEIVGYFVARYGDFVLLKPPYRGPGAVLWLAPLTLLLVLAVSAFFYIQHRRHTSLPAPPPLSPDDAARVHAARASDGP